MLQLQKNKKEEEDRYAAALAITQLREGFKEGCVGQVSPHQIHVKSHILHYDCNLKPGSPGLDTDFPVNNGNVSTISSDDCSTSPLDLTVKKRNEANHQTNLLTNKCTLNKGNDSESKNHIDLFNTSKFLNVEPHQRLNVSSSHSFLTGSFPIYILNNILLANSPRFSPETANIVALSQTLKAPNAVSKLQLGTWTGQNYSNNENTSHSEGYPPFMTTSTANSDISQKIKIISSNNIESQNVRQKSNSSQLPVKVASCLSRLTQLLPKGLSSIAKFYKKSEVKKPHVRVRKKVLCKDTKKYPKELPSYKLSEMELKHCDIKNVPIPVLASEDFECEAVANCLPSGLVSFREFYQRQESFTNRMKYFDKAGLECSKKATNLDVGIKDEPTDMPSSSVHNILLPISVAEESENDVLNRLPIMRSSSQKNNIKRITKVFKNHENCLKRKANKYSYGKTKHSKEDPRNVLPLHGHKNVPQVNISPGNIPVEFNQSGVECHPQLLTQPESAVIPNDIRVVRKDSNQITDEFSFTGKMTYPKLEVNPDDSLPFKNFDMDVPLNVLAFISKQNNLVNDVDLPQDKKQMESTAEAEVKLCTKVTGDDDIATVANGTFLNNSDVNRKEFQTISYQNQHLFISPDDDGDYPLHVAVMKGNLDAVLTLTRIIEKIGGDMSCRDAIRQTPLHLAIEMGYNDIVRCLMDFGANPCLLDSKGRSCLHLSILHGNEIGLELMLKHRNSSKFNYNVKDYEGLTVLHLAVLKGRTDALKLLVESRVVNIDEKEGKSGKTALYLAAESNQSKILALLLRKGASEKEADYSGYTPYQVAAMKPCEEVIKEFDSWQAHKEKSKLMNHNANG